MEQERNNQSTDTVIARLMAFGPERYLVFGDTSREFIYLANAQRFDSVSALIKASRSLRKGAILLPFGRETGFKSLGRLVAVLRQELPNSVRIFVREQDRRLRLRQVTVLERLGMTQHLPQNMAPLVIKRLIHAWEGRRVKIETGFSTEGLIHAARAREDFRGIDQTTFGGHVHGKLVSNLLNLPYTLVILHPMNDLGKEAILTGLSKGIRDAVYCDTSITDPRNPAATLDQGIWIFLHACTPVDCQAVLERTLGGDFETLLVGWRKVGKAEDIYRMVDHINDEVAYLDMAAA